jgi:hypothetical protein
MRATAVLIVAGALALPTTTFSADKGGKPKLDLRVSPRFAFSPVTVLLTANLVGGTQIAEYNCPELEWNWDDGAKSAHESDCEPLGPDGDIQRRYTASHEFRRAGTYNVTLTMRKGDKALAVQTVKVTVKPGVGDASSARDSE